VTMHIPSGILRVENIPYRTIDGHTLLLDIVRPDPLPPDPMPVVLFLFGSGWMENRRKDEEQNPAPFLAAHGGLCVVTIDYRLSSQAIFPAQIVDARAAIRWLRAHADVYHLDAEHIGVWGYSAGGHVAAMLGTATDESTFDDPADRLEFSCRVQAVVTVSCPVDFLQMGDWHNDPDSAEARLIGGPVQEHKDWACRANPISYITRDAAPFLLVHGDQDEVVRIQQAHLLYNALSQASVDIIFLPLPGAGHHLGRSTPYWDGVSKAALTFFNKHLGFRKK
jgi:acetyl esterase/lipase